MEQKIPETDLYKNSQLIYGKDTTDGLSIVLTGL